ncbi:hypothetical protein niasHT_016936 [Heterodera trifolii]|uniref:DNA-directed DNA polymerase n=1 Tax=Heterodera trifolii TaxID=157864 RepID=A0ABD2L2Z9_9BILA
MEFILTKVPNVEIFWQCEIEEMLSKDREMKQKFKEYTGDGGPINIRDCFMGGRTGALKLYHELAADEEISYYDFTSLYPFINCVTDYPVGHQHFMFRLNAALEEGYRVTMLLRVLEYNKSDNQLFRPYMSEFMVQKLHASGFDEEIRGNFEAEERFINECREKFDIKIDRAKMIPNKGKRALAKLAVNNLWGRFYLRNYGLDQTFITEDPSELGNYLDNRKIEVTGLDMLTPERIFNQLQSEEGLGSRTPLLQRCHFTFHNFCSSPALAKSNAESRANPCCTILYTDTDSLIYVHPKGANPLKTGPHLGEFTDEFPKHDIMEFVSGGAKQYGLKLRKKGSENEFDYVLKLRGITLNYDVTKNQGLCYDTFKTRVLEFVRTGKSHTNQNDDDVDTDPSPEEVEKWTPEEVIEWEKRIFGKMPPEEELWQEIIDGGDKDVLLEFFGEKDAQVVQKSLNDYTERKERRDEIFKRSSSEYEESLKTKSDN